jgi:hypothetical protein
MRSINCQEQVMVVAAVVAAAMEEIVRDAS